MIESSGPVSPRFFYTLAIRLEGLQLKYSHSQQADVTGTLSPRQFENLWAKLEKLRPLHDLVDEAGRERVGISVNRFRLRMGGQEESFDYTLMGLEESPPHLAVVRALKRLAKAVAKTKPG